MTPAWRNFLIAGFCSLLAIWVGVEIAHGEIVWPVLLGLVAIGAVLARVFSLSVDVVVLGLVLTGYFVGNRGFAQLTLLPGLPLFPAEGALLLAGAWRLVVLARERAWPWPRNLLNGLVLLWLVLGTARVGFDVRTHGLLAVRDYAVVYYAALFFLTQEIAREARAREFLHRCLLVGLLMVPVSFAAFELFPAFLLTQLTVRGAPLIFFKGDLANTFLAAGSLVIFFWARGRQRWWAWPLCAALFAYVLFGENRASAVGLLGVTLMMLAARRWLFPVWQLSAATLVGVIVFAVAMVSSHPWAVRKIDGVADRVRSIADMQGLASYASEESFNKGDNNRFRWIWWRSVVEETTQTNPVFGLGFGHDLARGFVQEYSPEISEEFTARSPHNIFVTAYGRLGALGLLVWTAVAGVIGWRAWRSLRTSPESAEWALWGMACLILVSATFGVVLEGPMGAVPFWVALGLASVAESGALPPPEKP
ncbi:MAG: O-antigen ligase family protein [Candidatus Didemnitutus sp.]|nr:O-antigen ligase family protein [Candidatus Didemnitutus sp.]